MQDILAATRSYERWLGQHLPLIPSQLRRKHTSMAESAFIFMRATLYRWMQGWRETAELAGPPRVLAVADLHLENFGTWRDIEGRLVWGVNDFDEAVRLPYTADLLRLATSALLAVQERHLSLSARSACAAILEGYGDAIRQGGSPFVLGEQHKWLRRIAENALRSPAVFWRKIDRLPKAKKVPATVRHALAELLPEKGIRLEYALRTAGKGSLGRPRYVASANWKGGRIVREAKALAPSAAVWAGVAVDPHLHYQRILNGAVRCPDPFVRVESGWIVRRLSPDCSRIELADLAGQRNEDRLLYAMGWEAANVHLGTAGSARAIAADLGRRKRRWLEAGAQDWADWVKEDWKAWRRLHPRPSQKGA